jgi:acyl-coenzyme A thioesterase PaaI-like protein
MTATELTETDIPEGFEPHFRPSPLTKPWEPIYHKKTPDAVMLGLRLAEPHTNSRGIAHGGFITAMADNAMGLSCGMKRDAGITRLITASLGVDFIASARIGQWVAFEPEIIKLGNSLCFVQCFVTADGARIARANGTFSVVTKRV